MKYYPLIITKVLKYIKTMDKQMKEKIKHYIKEILLFVIVMTLFANIISLYKSTELNKEPIKIMQLTLIDNTNYTVPKDKPLLIHFWATWCPTCSLEASNIQRISEDYEVITIAVKSDSKEIMHYMKENNLNFKVVNDKNGIIASEFNIAAYPTTFIYDKNKELLFSEVGYTSTFGLYLRMWWANLSSHES